MTTQFTIGVDSDLYEQFKTAVSQTGDNMTTIVERWFQQYLDAREDAIDTAIFDERANELGGRPLRDILVELSQRVEGARGRVSHFVYHR